MAGDGGYSLGNQADHDHFVAMRNRALAAPVYKDTILAKNSQAYELWDAWQKAKSDRNKHQKKLDDHLKQLDKNHEQLLERYK